MREYEEMIQELNDTGLLDSDSIPSLPFESISNRSTANTVADMSATEVKDALEAWIDRNKLSDILMLLSDICREKADHLYTNWQDRQQGSIWDKAGNRIETLGYSLESKGI